MPLHRILINALIMFTLLASAGAGLAADEAQPAESGSKPSISFSREMDDVMLEEATKVKEEFEQKARSLFDRRPLGWDLKTIAYLYELALSLPGRIPVLTAFIIEQSKILGVIGSIMVIIFIAAILYSFLGQRRVMRWVEKRVEPLSAFIPEATYPFVMSGIRVVVSALIPLLLLAAFAIINAMIDYSAGWFQLIGRLLLIWTVGALSLRLLKESLTRDLFAVTKQHGRTIHRWARLALLYATFGIAVYWSAKVFEIPEDVLALLRFAVTVSIVTVLLIMHLNKKAFMSLLPELPYPSYRRFRRFLERSYYLLMFISFLAALAWSFGYHALGQLVLFKIWFTGAAFVAIVLIYHGLGRWLSAWSGRLDKSDENARMFAGSMRSLLKYATVVATLVVILNLLGLLNPLQRLMSFPIFQLQNTSVTLWIIVKAVLILMAFIFLSRLAQTYLDYKVYPSFGIDTGLGYALNTVFKYITLGIGFLVALNIVGLNLRFLLVFAGAIGIGIGLGLQNLAANLISGFTIIFGGKIRKGDWVEVEGMVGEVTDIHLRATNVRTRDNIEYLVPNSNIVSNTIVNYSLSSPLIRIELPVGVSYDADPREVEQILLRVAEKEPLVSKAKPPGVRFTAYADSSINFELLVWIDVRAIPRRRVRSELYFAIFEELAKAGIEIPFPQRDLHLRSTVAPKPA